jgi:hypothetical protein
LRLGDGKSLALAGFVNGFIEGQRLHLFSRNGLAKIVKLRAGNARVAGSRN